MKSAFIWVIVFSGIVGCESQIPDSEPMIIGHRGLPTIFPENTKESFDGLLAADIKSVEMDILLAKGDTIMVFHDPEVSRLTNMTGSLNSFTPTEIKKGMKLKIGGTGLTLNEFLDLYSSKFDLIFMDLKQGQADAVYVLIDQLITRIKTENLYQKIVITSPLVENLEYIQSKDLDVQVAIDENELGIKTAVAHHFGYCLMSIDNMSTSLYNFARLSNVKLIAYTTKNIIEVEKAIMLGCDGVMTDVPLEMKTLYGR